MITHAGSPGRRLPQEPRDDGGPGTRTPTGPFDVIVKIGGAGVCRTDIHILEGQWAEKSGVALPYTIGHENAGWVHAVGSAVTNVAEGDKVILHPLVTCGLCRACRFGDDVHCENIAVPGHQHRRRLRRVPEDFGAQRASRSTTRSSRRTSPPWPMRA